MAIYHGSIYYKGRNKSGKHVHKVRSYSFKGAKRKQKNITAYTKRASRSLAEEYLHKLKSGEVNESSNSFDALVKAWRAERVDTCKLGTLSEYDRFVQTYINPFFGNRKDITSIKPMDIQAFNQNLIGEGKSSNVRIQVLTILRGIFKFGVRNHLLKFDPTTAIRKPRPKTRDVYVLTKLQQQTLLNAAKIEKYKMLFALAMFTGLRQGELLGLRWSSVDFERSRIIVREQYTDGHWDSPKGKRSRHVPFDNRTATWLKCWRAECPSRELVFPVDSDKPRDADKPMDAKNMCNREWRPALKRSGIQAEIEASGHPSFRFHDLRHVYASRMLDSGASIWELKTTLGHVSVTTTEKSYAHLVPGFLDRLRDRTGELTAGIELEAEPTVRAVNF